MAAAGSPDEIVLTVRAVRELDRRCIEEYGIPGVVLMENAGRGAAQALLREGARSLRGVDFLCGPGNNGGDAYVAARHLDNAGVPVRLFATHAREASRGDGAWARSVAERMGLELVSIADESSLARACVGWSGERMLVDGLLGTGTSGPPRGSIAAALRAAATARPVLRVALDLPSGLDADTGLVHEPCFRADLTLTFAARKPGLSAAVSGRVEVVGIGAPRRLLAELRAT